MESTEKKNILVMITQGIPKPIVYSLIVLMIGGAISFSFAFVKTTDNTNKELPQLIERTIMINQKVDKLTIDNEIGKLDALNMKESVKNVSEELKAQHEILLQILYRTNQTYNNTK